MCPHCHELFCSKSTSATESSRTFSPCRGVVFSSRSCCSPRVTERYQRSHCVSRLQQMISSVRLPTALVSAPASVQIVVCLLPLLPNYATVNAVPRSSGTLASLAKQSNKLLQPVTTRMGKCSSLHSSREILFPINTSHNIARVYSARSRASRLQE